MNKFNLLLALFLVTMGIFSYRITMGFFSDTETSTNNVFTAAAAFPTPTPTPCVSTVDHIVMNEISSDGAAKKEWVELFNPTCNSIDVSGWRIADKIANNNGQDDTFPTVSSIPPNGFAVVVTNNTEVIGIPVSAITITLTSANIGSGLNDGGDEVYIKNGSNTVIDKMSYGDETAVFPSPPPAPTASQSLARSPNGVDTDTAADWAIDSTPSIGVSN